MISRFFVQHYNLDRENLQFLAMKLGCKARSLYNELRSSVPTLINGKSEQVTTSTLAAVADIIDGVKDLISWLDRYTISEKYVLD